MHHERESLQVLGTNKGRLSVADSRTSFTNPTVMEFNNVRDSSNFLSEIINQYSSVLFLDDSRSIVTRDLISVKIWDMRSAREPVRNIYIDEGIKDHVCDLF
jgi:serine/threonine-protein phosphatase 2A regulatory subunit B